VQISQDNLEAALPKINYQSLGEATRSVLTDLGIGVEEAEITLSEISGASFGPGSHDLYDTVRSSSGSLRDLSESFGCLRQSCVVQAVDVDIKPGSFPNTINLEARGKLPVAILSSEVFDATQIDVDTVKFGPAGVSEVHQKAHFEDVDEDGDVDLVLHFGIFGSGLECGAAEATIIGTTYVGQVVSGSDDISLLHCQ
jgi:hypothetical protein